MDDDDYEDLLGRYESTKRNSMIYNSAGVNESGFNAHGSDMGVNDIVEINSSGQQRINTCPDEKKRREEKSQSTEVGRGERYVRSALDDY